MPALVGLEPFLGDFDQKETSAWMKQKAKQDSAKEKEPINYSTC